MNERFKELAEQSGFGLRRDGEIYTPRLEHLPITEDLTKFAELIVRECADMAESFHRHQYDMTGNLELHEFIREHFGVKE